MCVSVFVRTHRTSQLSAVTVSQNSTMAMFWFGTQFTSSATCRMGARAHGEYECLKYAANRQCDAWLFSYMYKTESALLNEASIANCVSLRLSFLFISDVHQLYQFSFIRSLSFCCCCSKRIRYYLYDPKWTNRAVCKYKQTKSGQSNENNKRKNSGRIY